MSILLCKICSDFLKNQSLKLETLIFFSSKKDNQILVLQVWDESSQVFLRLVWGYISVRDFILAPDRWKLRFRGFILTNLKIGLSGFEVADSSHHFLASCILEKNMTTKRIRGKRIVLLSCGWDQKHWSLFPELSIWFEYLRLSH